MRFSFVKSLSAFFPEIDLIPLLCMVALFCGGSNIAYAAKDSEQQKSLSLTGVNLSLRVLLQGAYDDSTGLMRSSLQDQGLLPEEQPYTSAPFEYDGTEQIGGGPAAMTGQDAVVDWLLLELRSADNSDVLVAQKAVLLQRDGDVVEASDGAVVISFPGVPARVYQVVVRHRMHIGVMSDALLLNTDVRVFDFSNHSTPVVGDMARVKNGQFALLWGGDSTQDNRLIASGVGNDSNPVLSNILLAPQNGGFNSSYILPGYRLTDFNMDGKTIYAGPNNDVNFLVANVLAHPLNTDFANNYIVDTKVDF